MKTIVLTGGGTAGHVIPNIALLPLLKKEGYEIHYIGSKHGIEKKLLDRRRNVAYHGIPSGKFRRYFSLQNLIDPFKILFAFFKALSLIKKINPGVCFSKGGFVSVPVVLACAARKVPVVLHESDMSPGLANKICRPYCKVMCTTFPEAAKFAGEKGLATGSPVRPEITAGDGTRGMIMCGFEPGRPALLIMGGSSGAVSLNQAVDDILDKLIEKYQIIHIRGEGNLRPALESRAGYRQFGYVGDELPHLMAAADLVLTRAGANAIFEFAALAKPMLLVPLPMSASRGDQIKNAEYFRSRGWANVLPQEDMTADSLPTALSEVYKSRDKYAAALQKSDLKNGLYRLFEQIKKAAKQP
jgi:UDP-N-acetylglucosamine--N-acetylmuramyl-(pentapeptide) pyrophosphoryl-undecaprenol N-acetylglucosamine transferase